MPLFPSSQLCNRRLESVLLSPFQMMSTASLNFTAETKQWNESVDSICLNSSRADRKEQLKNLKSFLFTLFLVLTEYFWGHKKQNFCSNFGKKPFNETLELNVKQLIRNLSNYLVEKSSLFTCFMEHEKRIFICVCDNIV